MAAPELKARPARFRRASAAPWRRIGLDLGPEAVIGVVQDQPRPQLQRGPAALDGLHQHAGCRLAVARMDRQHQPRRRSGRRAHREGHRSASARWIMVAVPPARAMAAMKRTQRSRSPSGMALAAGLQGIAAPPCRALRYGRADWRGRGRSSRRPCRARRCRARGATRRPRSARTRPARSLRSMLPRASPARPASRSTSVTCTSGKTPRHRQADHADAGADIEHLLRPSRRLQRLPPAARRRGRRDSPPSAAGCAARRRGRRRRSRPAAGRAGVCVASLKRRPPR